MSDNTLHIGGNPTLKLSAPVINEIIEAISPTVSVETISGGHEVTITDKNGDHTFDVMDGGGAGGMDYDNLENKPQIEGVTLTGDTSLASLGAASTEDIPDISGLYTKPDDGIPSTDMTSAVQTSLGKADSAYQKPGSGIPGTDLASGVLTSIIDDTAGDGDTNKVWSADKSADLMSAIQQVTPEQFGAKGDGTTDDSQAVQNAVDAGYAVYFGSNKTYYLASTVTVDHDCHIYGGKNTVIKTKTPSGSYPDNAIVVTGTLKKETTLTSNYTNAGDTACTGNRFKLTDMTGVEIGDIIEITAEDQYYSLARPYYYLGGTMLIVDKDSEYLYVADALPFDITNTENVTVKVYSAPSVVIEDLKFVSDLDNPGNYKYCLTLDHCKNSVVRRCVISDTDNGINLKNCVNVLVEDVLTYKLAESGAQTGDDHYGICIYSSTNTIIERVLSAGGNCAVSMGGHIPNINTYFYCCNLFGSNFTHGIDMHENAFNTVIEDCVMDEVVVYGTVQINRCRFVKSKRKSNHTTAIIFRGSDNRKYAILKMSNTTIDAELSIVAGCPVPQRPVGSFNNIIGLIDIQNCEGGYLSYTPSTSETILSNRIEKLIISKWYNCKEIYHTDGNIIDLMIISDSTFTSKHFITKHNNALYFGFIRFARATNTYPQMDRIFVDETKGGQYYLKEGNSIVFESSDSSAHYVVCGENVQSNKAEDYYVGNVSGTAGNAITRTQNATFSNSLSVNENGEIVFTQPSNSSSNMTIYPVCMQYVKKGSYIKTSCKIKNTGGTTGASFRIYVAIINAATGLITYRNNGSSGQATADGVVLTHGYEVPEDSIVMAYLYCYSAVAGSETTFSEFVTKIMPNEDIIDLLYEAYNGTSRTGDGSLATVDGLNNIATNASAAVSVKFNANLL